MACASVLGRARVVNGLRRRRPMLASPIVRRGPGVEGRWGAGSLQLQLLLTLALLAVVPVLFLGAVQAKVAEDNEVERSDRETLLATSSLARELGRIVEANANVARALATEVASEGRADAALVGGKTERYL